MMSAISSISLLLNLRRAALADFSHRVHRGHCCQSLQRLRRTLRHHQRPGTTFVTDTSSISPVDLGGHIVTQSGSDAMYDTLVNIQSGPRILDSSFQMIAVNPAHALLFDHLSSTSFGYGGDPYNVTFLNFSKGRIYDFHGSFRRNRQYFDYNLLANPLIPPTSTPFVPSSTRRTSTTRCAA